MKNLTISENDSESRDSLKLSELEKLRVLIANKILNDYLSTVGISKTDIKVLVVGEKKGQIFFLLENKTVGSMTYEIEAITKIKQKLFCDVQIGDLWKFTVVTEASPNLF
jgi:hypothetical protein